jgi:hypothetical protein
MQQTVVKFIALLYSYCSTCFRHHNAHHQEPIKPPLQPLVSVWMCRRMCSRPLSVSLTNRPRPRTHPPAYSYGNQRLQRQFDRLLMMGIVMPETCWAISVQQGNKFYDCLLHLVGCFIRVFDPTFCVPVEPKHDAIEVIKQSHFLNFNLHIIVLWKSQTDR